MHELDDIALLRQYTEQNSEEAFAALVTRHINKVYSVALRHTRNPHQAEEITQAVFVILARKSPHFGRRVILEGWLYQTARLTAMTFVRGEIRRARREQEAHMQTLLNEDESDVWTQIAPLLDLAMAELNETDRHALVLRFFYGKSMKDVGAVLGGSEDAAKMRLNRAVEKLQKFFLKRGIVSTTATLAGAISANSLQAAPATLAKSVTTVAMAKGVAASGSTLTLIKGALKVMAWSKANTAIVVSVVVLLAAGTTTITVKKIQEYRTDQWDLPNFDDVPTVAPTVLWKTPPQVRLMPSKYNHFVVGFAETTENSWQCIGVGQTLDGMIQTAYGSDSLRTVFLNGVPKGRYDYISNLRQGTAKPFQDLIKKKLSLIGKKELRETDVLVLRLSNPDVHGFKSPGSLVRSMNLTNIDVNSPQFALGGDSKFSQTKNASIETRFNTPVDMLRRELEIEFQLPIVDETGLTNRYDFSMTWPVQRTPDNEALNQAVKEILLEQLGLELVPSNMPIEMLVVEKAQ